MSLLKVVFEQAHQSRNENYNKKKQMSLLKVVFDQAHQSRNEKDKNKRALFMKSYKIV